ncbi:MAG: hypothetical protein IJJ26_04230 [Victivallales bacterium]|nr:hypothetical protein [Victivallales bacterium]
MTLRIDTVTSMYARQAQLSQETVKADYSHSSTKAIKENILSNFGFWSRTKVSGALSVEHKAGNDVLGQMGAALARKPVGPEGNAALKVLAQVNEKKMGVVVAMTELGNLERQYEASHQGGMDPAARAFFTTARKVVLMAPIVDREVPDKMRQAAKSVAHISSQYERMERVFTADTLQEVEQLRGLFDWHNRIAMQSSDSELANASQMLVAILDGKRAMLQELSHISAKLAAGNLSDQEMMDIGESLETLSQACLVSNSETGQLQNLGRASLVGAVQNCLKQYYAVAHRQDMSRIQEMQNQLDQINFANDLSVDIASVDGLYQEISSVNTPLLNSGMFTQAMVDERTNALALLKKTAAEMEQVVALRTLERGFDESKTVGNAQLTAITQDVAKLKTADPQSRTVAQLEAHIRGLWDRMNQYANDRVKTPLAALQEELRAAKGVEEVRACSRKIEAELKTQLEFLKSPASTASKMKCAELEKFLNSVSRDAIMREVELAWESIDAHGGHTLQELWDNLTSQPHMNQSSVETAQKGLKQTSTEKRQAAMERLLSLETPISSFAIRDKTQVDAIFTHLKTYATVIQSARDAAARAMLAEDREAIEAKCLEMEAKLADKYSDSLSLLLNDLHLPLGSDDMKSLGELCRLGGFDGKLMKALLKQANEAPQAFREMNKAVVGRLNGKTGSTTELYTRLDKLMEMDPELANTLLQIKLKLASGMDPKKVHLLHDAAVASDNFERAMAKPSQNLSMERLGLYYFKNTTTDMSLRYMLGKIGMAGRNRPAGLNLAILQHLWMKELTKDATDDSPLPDVKARFPEFQAKLPEPFRSDKNLFAAMSFDVKELRFVEDFSKSMSALAETMDGARELQDAFDACAGQDDVYAARKALESLTRRYADCKSATSDQLMETGANVREGLFVACKKLPAELAAAFQIDGQPTEKQQAEIEAFAAKAEELRSASVLLTSRAKSQEAACTAIVSSVAKLNDTLQSVKGVEGKPFTPKKVTGATLAVCVLSLQAAVQGMEDDLRSERHSPTEEERQAAAQRMQARYNLLVCTRLPEGAKLSLMESRHHLTRDSQAKKLEKLRAPLSEVAKLPPEEGKRKLLEIAKEIQAFLKEGGYVDSAKAVLAHKTHDKQGSAQEVWNRAFDHAGLSGEQLAAERDLVFDAFPQELAGSAVRAMKAETQLLAAAKDDFAAAKKSLDETTQAFSRQVRKTLDDAVNIAVLDTFLHSDPPMRSAAELRTHLHSLLDNRSLTESPFFRQCQATLREKLAVPDYVSTNLLTQFFAKFNDDTFKELSRNVGSQGAQTFLMDLSAADRKPLERLQHREDTLRRTTALLSGMTEPDAMVTFNLGMTRGSTISAVAGRVSSPAARRESALQAGMAIRREGSEFVLTLSPNADGQMGKRVGQALIGLEQAAARAEGQFRDGMELHFENSEKCANFLADLMSGELELSSVQTNCTAVELLARKDNSLVSQRIDIAKSSIE